MYQDIKDKFVTALRSGEYFQIKGYLSGQSVPLNARAIMISANIPFQHNGVCAMGLLREIMTPGETFSKGCENGMLTYEQLDMCDLTTVQASQIVSMNDHKASFEDIANYVEYAIPVTKRPEQIIHQKQPQEPALV